MKNGFIQAFITTAEKCGMHTAIEDAQGMTTYDLLLRRAAAIGESLKAQNLPAESVIGLCFEKSADYIAALIGTWYAGLAFAPLPPSLPAARRDYIVRDADIRVFLDAQNLPAPLPADAALSPAPYEAAGLAYVMHTSGSTGTPKGVLVEHRGICNVLEAQITAFGLTPQSRSLFYLSISFDASLSDIGTALLSGGALVIAGDDTLRDGEKLTRFLRQHHITHCDMPPSLLRTLSPADMPESLSTVIIGGEACPPDAVRRWARRLKVINVYGPTETTICTSLCLCDAEGWDRPLLGTPFAGVEYRVIDGELYIGGCQIARGYLNLPELNARKFVTQDGARFYRSGDRVRQTADGGLEFLGRIDRQFKLRGQLVEPDEIETRLQSCTGIRKAAVIKTPEPAQLIAYVTAETALDESQVAAHLAAHLPVWMIPARIIRLDTLPQTVTGKTDYAALAARRIEAAGVFAQPESAREKQLWQLWRGAIGHDRFGIDQSFYSAGGDSLGIIRLTLDAARTDIDAAPADIAQGKSIREIAASQIAGEAFCTSAQNLRAQVTFDAAMKERLRDAAQRPHTQDAADKPVLLTGATGCLGARVLTGLLKSGKTVYAIARAENDITARQRTLATFVKYGLPLSVDAEERLHVLAGDVSLPHLGLSVEVWQRLTDNTTAVYHCAATVNMLADGGTLAPANLDAVRHVLDFALTGGRKDIHAASTLSVFVGTDQNSGVLHESDRLENVRRVYGGYAQTKFAAECLLLQVPENACRIWHYRFGLLTGDTQSGAAPDRDFLSMFGRGLAALGVLPDGFDDRLHVDITPVDYAARAMLHLANTAPAGIYHIAAKTPLSLGGFVSAMARAGQNIVRIDSEDWQDMLQSRPMDTAESAAALGLCRTLPPDQYARHRIMDLFQATDVIFDTVEADKYLLPADIICPAPDDALMDLYMRNIFSGVRTPLKICLFGPESTGKSTLAAKLAAHFAAPLCEEYAKAHIEKKDGALTLADIPQIAAGQRRAESMAETEAAARGLLICDTDLLTTTIWSRWLFDGCPAWIDALARGGHYDLYLLMDIDTPWVDDIHRYLPDNRADFLAVCEKTLHDETLPYQKLSGTWDQKFLAACAAIDRLNAQNKETKAA
ncbi:MAG: AMP-binding protein [Alphaproteobacteria bacterium]|nr:AMP-binding protein [Alphaproteobacteria bacterium]